jgi:hypothetical protein
MTNAITWIVSLLITLSPAGKTNTYLEAVETKEEGLVRYASIAKDLAEIVYDPNEQSAFKGQYGRAKTAALMLGIAYHESGGFRKDVDFQFGKHAFGDKGRSVCLMQINVGDGKTPEGWTKSDLKDRKKCFRTALHKIHDSFKRCSHFAPEFWLSAYTAGLDTSGKCFPTGAAKIRFNDAKSLYESKPIDDIDEMIMKQK